MKFTEYFDRMLVLNLPSRADRRREMKHELDLAGWPFTPGKVELFTAIRPSEPAGFPSIGVRGCFLSHLEMLKKARESGWSRLLVMEDDLTISRKLGAHEDQIVEFLQKNPWDFVFFGHRLELSPTGSDSIAFERFDDTIVTAHFYAIQERIFERVIQFMEVLQLRPPGHPEGGPMYPDGAYSWFRTHNPDVVTWVANPNLGWQRSSRSDLHSNEWYDHTPVFRQLLAVARKVKQKLKKHE
jgi:glycosyl transferase, family 25